MTDFLHLAQTTPTRDTAGEAHNPASSDVTSMTATPTIFQVMEAQVGAQEHESALTGGDHSGDDDLSAEAIAALPTRRLRALVNRTYKFMDTDYPPAGTLDRYEMIVEELERRVQQAEARQPVRRLKETFRNNPLYRRFEFFIDGELAGYVKYTMNGGRIVLIESVEQPDFRDQGINATLMRNIVLDAHKRRLNLVPQCPSALSFFADHPQYQALTPRFTH